MATFGSPSSGAKKTRNPFASLYFVNSIFFMDLTILQKDIHLVLTQSTVFPFEQIIAGVRREYLSPPHTTLWFRPRYMRLRQTEMILGLVAASGSKSQSPYCRRIVNPL